MQDNIEMKEWEGNENPIKTAVDAGKRIADLKQIPRQPGTVKTYFLRPYDFVVDEIDNDLPNPLRKTGAKVFHSEKSFCAYVNKHKKDGETVIIADEERAKVTAILNDHGKDTPNHGDFKAVLDVGFSKQWEIWVSNSFNGARQPHVFTQAAFADHIENNRTDFMVGSRKGPNNEEIVSISPLALKELISKLEITASEKVVSCVDNVTGNMRVTFENDKEKINVEIPTEFYLAIPIYRGGRETEIMIRIRRRREQEKILFFYIIDDLEKTKEWAFENLCQRLQHGNVGSETDENKQFPGTGIEVLKGQL